MRTVKWLYPLIAVAFLAAAAVALAADTDSDLGSQANAIMKPMVRVTAGSAAGSGTIIYSEDREGTGECRTFVLTNHHVIDGAVHVTKKWDNLKQRYFYAEENDRVQVEVFQYMRGGRTVVAQPIEADIIAYDADHDIALLELDYPIKLDAVAKFLPVDRKLRMLQPVWAVGCGLRVDPIVTAGHVMDLEELIDHKTYTMASADIIWGNSGGAVFVSDGGAFYFVGIPSRVRVAYYQAVTYMGYFVPIERIRGWLASQKLTFLLDESVTPTAALEERAKMAKPRGDEAAPPGANVDPAPPPGSDEAKALEE